jgi:predicted RNA-binding Zn-ribbon protein involved in translation (DUF1610 family)
MKKNDSLDNFGQRYAPYIIALKCCSIVIVIMASKNEGTFLKWTCRKCGKEFGYGSCQYDGETCYQCAPGDDKFKREQQGWHYKRVDAIRHSMEHEKFLNDLKCPTCNDKMIKCETIEWDKITVKCETCGAILHEEKREVAKQQCPVCGKERVTTKYGDPEYETINGTSSCHQHGVDESKSVRIKIKNVENMGTWEGCMHERNDCMARYFICQLYDERHAVKQAVFEWLKKELEK